MTRARLSEPARLLRDLIATPSINPAFAQGRAELAGEGRVADLLAQRARAAGLDVELRPVLADRSNLLARLAPTGRPKQRILLAPHMDTVGNAELLPSLFDPRLVKNRIHGRGACDTKGSVAAMFSSLARIAASGGRPAHTEIVFAGLIDEENGQRGSRALAGQGFQASLAIVGEPTQCRVVTAHKGGLWLALETQGRSAHGSRPELGSNAIHRMATLVQAIEVDYAKTLSKRSHPVLRPPTVNVGTIQGGTQPNVVPDLCRISIDRRTIPGETKAAVERELLALARKNGIQARMIDLRDSPCPPLETNPDLPLVRSLMSLTRQKTPLGVDYFCDAAILAGGGTPSVVFGPGNIAQAHTADEWIEIASLDKATDLLTAFLRQLP